ncbi:MAG: glycosyltransferase [Gammaproteobacteria bacterium]|nr:glycosyltransferase [Gammaproteobacteria bacterium]
MKISFFVSSILSAYWNGAATYYRGLARELHARGHRLHFYEPDAYERQSHRDLDAAPPWAEVTVYAPGEWADVSRCLREASRSDFVVKASGVGVGDDVLDAEIASLGSSGRASAVYWDVDSPATLARLEADRADPLRALLPAFDHVLCYGGGEPARRRYLALGARRCDVIYNALDPTSHHPVASDGRFEGDLGFLGNRLPDREKRVDAFFFEPARRLADRRFVLGGSGWEDRAGELPNVNWVGHVYTADHNAFNVTPKAVINISRDEMAGVGYAPATRVFEAAGSGACLITDAWEGIELFLAPDEEVLVAHGPDDVARFVHELTPERARRIGQRARRRMLGEHTYRHRAAQLEDLLAGADSRAASA